MTNDALQKRALEILEADAEHIMQLILNQKNYLCIAECPAFEEVVDTQMYGFSKEIKYAIALGGISELQGKDLMKRLENALNSVYSDVYDQKSEG